MRRIRMMWIVALLVACGTLSSYADGGPVRMRSCRPMLSKSAVPLDRMKAKRSEPGDHYIGERSQLTVLVNFNDQAFAEEEPLELWERIFNEEGFNENRFIGSVHDYFSDQSYGQMNVTFDLFHVSLDQPRSRYRSTDSDDENSQYLVADIMEALSEEDVEWPRYDWDGDGYVDQLLIVFAGKGQNAGGDRFTIWPHQWWMSQHVDPETQEQLRAIPVVYHGTVYLVDCYCAVAELDMSGSYGTFGTLCHEYSHCFGFPDFYYGSTSFLEKWDLMDYGNYNDGGYCPTGYSAHERMLMGWLTPTELTENQRVDQMKSLSDDAEAYLIRNDGYENEFYIVENRQQTKWDRYLPGNGVVVFHIDYDPELWISTTDFVNTYQKQCYNIIPANGLTYYKNSNGWPYPYQDNDSLTNTSTPPATLFHANTDGKNLMSKSIYDIQVNDGLASFRFELENESAIQESTSRGNRAIETLYRMGRLHIVRYDNGEIRKVIVP